MGQLMTRPSKQSMMGETYTLPVEIWNSAMSVSHFSFGAAAWKSQSILGWITELTYGRPEGYAELDLQLNRSKPVFV